MRLLGLALVIVGLPGLPGALVLISRGFANVHIAERQEAGVTRAAGIVLGTVAVVLGVPFYVPLWFGMRLLGGSWWQNKSRCYA